MNLVHSLITCLFSQTITVRSRLQSVRSSTMNSCPYLHYPTCISSCGAGLSFDDINIYMYVFTDTCIHSGIHTQALAHTGNLNVIDPHNLLGSDTIRRCGFVRVGMTLLEEMCHCGCRLWGLIYAQDTALMQQRRSGKKSV